jgi:hypothetical protein
METHERRVTLLVTLARLKKSGPLAELRGQQLRSEAPPLDYPFRGRPEPQDGESHQREDQQHNGGSHQHAPPLHGTHASPAFTLCPTMSRECDHLS